MKELFMTSILVVLLTISSTAQTCYLFVFDCCDSSAEMNAERKAEVSKLISIVNRERQKSTPVKICQYYGCCDRYDLQSSVMSAFYSERFCVAITGFHGDLFYLRTLWHREELPCEYEPETELGQILKNEINSLLNSGRFGSSKIVSIIKWEKGKRKLEVLH